MVRSLEINLNLPSLFPISFCLQERLCNWFRSCFFPKGHTISFPGHNLCSVVCVCLSVCLSVSRLCSLPISTLTETSGIVRSLDPHDLTIRMRAPLCLTNSVCLKPPLLVCYCLSPVPEKLPPSMHPWQVPNQSWEQVVIIWAETSLPI